MRHSEVTPAEFQLSLGDAQQTENDFRGSLAHINLSLNDSKKHCLIFWLYYYCIYCIILKVYL